MEGLTEGRIVHYVLESGEHRPAIVVKVWRKQDSNVVGLTKDALDNGCSNLQVFTDSDADGRWNDVLPPVLWKTSVVYSEEPKPSTWHWIEKA